MKTWLKRISVLFAAVITIITVWYVTAPPAPVDCSLCGHLKCHAPCILNLATGEIGELELYQPHFRKVGEIAEEQTGGTFSFICPAGLQGIRLTDPWYIEVSVLIVGGWKNDAHFCLQCREKLEQYMQGFVLLDLYGIDDPDIYAISENVEYEIRCYEIEITIDNNKNYYNLRMNGIPHR